MPIPATEQLASGEKSPGAVLLGLVYQSAAFGLLSIACAWIAFATDIDVFDDLAITFVSVIVETKASTLSVWLAKVFFFLETGDIVALANSTNGVRNVVQFVDQSVANSSPTDSGHAECQRDDQHQFGGDQKTVFVFE
jgi:hypothetical protein